MQLPKKSGIALRCRGDPSSLLNCARDAESAGFNSLWLVEVAEADVLALAGAISQTTSRIKIATGVVNANLRLPTLLAMGAATISELSRGRFVLGVGAGDPPMSYSIDIPENTALTRLFETLEIVRLCLSGESVEYKGRLYEVHGFKLGLKLRYQIPIFGAAMGLRMVKAVLNAGGDILLMLPTLDYMKKIGQTINSTSNERSGKKKEVPSVACHLVTAVSESRNDAEETAKRAIMSYLGIPVYRNSFVRMGFSEEVCALESTDQERNLDDSWKKVPTSMAENLIIFGTPEECVKKINSFASLGVTEPVVYPCMTEAGFPSNVNETIRLLAPFLQEG